MRVAMEHCVDTVMEHCDEKNSGALSLQGPWSIVMTSVMGHFDDIGMEHYDDKSSGAF